MVKIVQKKRSMRESLERIDNYLMKKRGFVTLTKISQELNLHFDSIKKCIQTLDKFGRVEIVSNGSTTFVRFKEDKNAKKPFCND